MPNAPIVDTNVVLRYLLQDHSELSLRATTLIEGNRRLLIPNEVLCEVVYVLAKVYEVPRPEIASTLAALARRPNLLFENREVVTLAIETFSLRSLDIVDALLFARRRVEGVEVITFDRALQKLCL